jgi:hypothetical protein
MGQRLGDVFQKVPVTTVITTAMADDDATPGASESSRIKFQWKWPVVIFMHIYYAYLVLFFIDVTLSVI